MTARRWSLAAVGVGWLGLTGALMSLAASPAQADLKTNLAECQGQVEILGDDGTTTNIDQDTNRFTIDPSGSYSGTGSINGGGKAPKPRDFSGGVVIDLPPGLPNYSPSDWGWSGNGKGYSSDGPKSGTYDLPNFVPRGFYVTVIATHTEPSGVVCKWVGEVKVTGSFFDSPISTGSLVGTAVFGGLATAAGVPRKRLARKRLPRKQPPRKGMP